MRRDVAVLVDQRAAAADVANGPDATCRRVLSRLFPKDHPQLHEDARQKQKIRVNALAPPRAEKEALENSFAGYEVDFCKIKFISLG